MSATTFDAERLQKQSDAFIRFDVSEEGVPVSSAQLPGSTELIVFERCGQRRALLVREMAYHHLAQGRLVDEPYIVSFCGVCHSGVGMTPVVNGEIHHFQVGGLYDGVAILIDDETGTYWNHITGEAVYGSLVGSQLDIWSLEMTTVAAAMVQEPELKVVRSGQRPMFSRAMWFGQWLFGKTGYLPKLFTQTMAPEDTRLPRMTMGVGVVIEGAARFYPIDTIKELATVKDALAGQSLELAYDEKNGVPRATQDNGVRPLQYFLRWYGFALTYPSCSIYSP